jgi:amidase
MTVKESFDVIGLPTTWGSPNAMRTAATEDAAAVKALKDAGAVVIGKTNLHFQYGKLGGAHVPLLLHDWQSFNPVYGTTRNPWNTTRTPGGSSGGSAAALACRYVTLELGSDVGGSLRAPAHFCGVYAHKPTSGLVSGQGHAPPGSSGPPRHPELIDMAVYGPMALAPDDLDLSLGLLVATQRRLVPSRHQKLRDFSVFLIDTHPLMPVSDDVRMMLNNRAADLERAGVRVTRVSALLPDLPSSARMYMRALSKFDAMGWGDAEVEVIRHASRKLAVKDRTLSAERLRGATLSDAEIKKVLLSRQRIQAQWKRFFQSFDVLLCPIMPTTAFPHDHSADQEARHIRVNGKAYPYLDQLFWPGIATFPGLPATACPLGVARDRLPVGMQVVGPWLEDRTAILFAGEMDRAFGGAPTLVR